MKKQYTKEYKLDVVSLILAGPYDIGSISKPDVGSRRAVQTSEEIQSDNQQQSQTTGVREQAESTI